MSALSYMQRRVSGTYEFRRRLPEALAGKAVPPHMRTVFSELINPKTVCFKRELVRSLGTKDVKEAKRRDHREALKASQLFDDAVQAIHGGRSPILLSQVDLAELAEEVCAELLGADETEREDGDDRRHLQTAEERARWPDLVPAAPNASAAVPLFAIKGMAQDHFLAYGDLISEFEGEYREAFARKDPTIVQAETQIALKRRGVPFDRSSPEFRQASLAVLKAHVQAYDAMRARQRGEIIETPVPKAHRDPKLSEAFDAWKQGGAAKGAKKPNHNTVIEAEQALRYFQELHGDMHLGDISREKARQFRDAIAKVPRAMPRKLRKLPLRNLLEQDLSGYQPRSAATVNKLLTLLGAIVSQAERDGFLDRVPSFANPFGKGIRFAIQEQDAARVLFDKADLRTIFGSPVYTEGLRPVGGCGEAAFWFPLIGLFSGMRLDEIAQLRICDLRRDDETGRWFFDVSRNGGRSPKTVSSIRHVPLHRELVRIGLLRYRQMFLDKGAGLKDSLWPSVKAGGARQRSAAWSKWFGRYLRETCGVTDTAKVFHSFRHTFKRMTRDAGLLEEQHDALTGHSGGSSIGRSYGRGFSLVPLLKAVDKTKAPLALTHLKWTGSRAG